MLDEPCPACGRLMDINEDACPACGWPRRRTRGRRRPVWVSIVVVLLAAWCGGTVGSLLEALAMLFTPHTLGIGQFLGGILGAVAGVVLLRLIIPTGRP